MLQAIGLLGQRDAIRLDLTRHGPRVEKAKVGPLGSVLVVKKFANVHLHFIKIL